MQYTAYQKWLSTNLHAARDRTGYGLLQKIFKPPDALTMRKHLSKLKDGPDTNGKIARILVKDVAPVKSHESL